MYNKNTQKGRGDSDPGQRVQEMIENAVNTMDFSRLSQDIRDVVGISAHDAVDAAKDAVSTARDAVDVVWDTVARDVIDPMRKPAQKPVQKPVLERQPKGWIRRIPGTWSGPVRTVLGVGGVAVFGALSLGFGLAGLGVGMLGTVSVIVLESVFIPLTLVSAVLLGTGRAAAKRVRRIREYAGIWGNQGFVMMEDLRRRTGYSMKKIIRDLQFFLESHLIPSARMDEQKTCLMLTEEAGRQYDAAMEAKREREREELSGKEAEAGAKDGQGDPNRASAGNNAAGENLTGEQRRLREFQKTGGDSLQEIRAWRQKIRTPEMTEKIGRLELLLGRIFLCIQQYPENISRADRLTEYYLPSVLKLIRVYADLEGQPIQSANIIKTRMEIAESLDMVNQALEAMYDDLFQDVALDISSDIQVLETMLAKDGWGGQDLRASQREGTTIWQ